MKKLAIILASLAFLSVGCVESSTEQPIEETIQNTEKSSADTSQTLIKEKLEQEKIKKSSDDSASLNLSTLKSQKIARE